MDRLDALRVFLRVAELGSFSRAAEALALPRATVSVAVAKLETDFSARLLHRTTRHVSVTADGMALLQRGRQLLDDFETLRTRLDGGARSVGGRLSVDLPSRLARRVVVPALPKLLARHPTLAIDLSSDDRLIDLVEAGVDCAVRVGALETSSLVARPLGRLAMLTCASPAYLAAQGVPATPADLDRHWAVHYRRRRQGGADPEETTLFDHQPASGEATRVPVRCRITVHTSETYVAAARAGLGLVQVPAFDVQDVIERGELVEVLAAWRPAPLPVHALYPHRRHPSARLRMFLTWIAGLLRPLAI